MTYLDYSATTPVNSAVLDSFYEVSNKFIGNPNSLHKLGVESKNLIDNATKQIGGILKVLSKEIIYTSGASESNNLAIKGIAYKYGNRGKHIITTNFEHSSIYGPLSYLQKEGYSIDFVNTDSNGLVDIKNLKELIRDDTILVSICAVNSEIGIKQNIEEIGELISKYPKCFFHVDMTQSIGKVSISLKNVDLASFSAHKFYGIKGIGILIKKENVSLEPLIHGGKSTTIYRSGTPSPALIASTSKALRLSYENIDKNYQYVLSLNKYLKEKLAIYDNIYINSNVSSIPHILNISIIGIKPETMLHALEEHDIYISTQTACSIGNASKGVMALTNSEARATSSIRISLSHLTTKDELDYFLDIFDKKYKQLNIK